jgi:protein-S-isoprenylcysteine O-methyltransferase Ste14
MELDRTTEETCVNDTANDTPNVIGFPPLYFLGPLAAGLLLHRLRPSSVLPWPLARIIGVPLLASGLALGAWGFATMRRAGTSPDVHKPTSQLVTDGPFGYTRNPLYTSLALIYLGVATLLNARLPLLWLPAVLAAVERGVITREESYLARRFGPDYEAYRVRVRRWL